MQPTRKMQNWQIRQLYTHFHFHCSKQLKRFVFFLEIFINPILFQVSCWQNYHHNFSTNFTQWFRERFFCCHLFGFVYILLVRNVIDLVLWFCCRFLTTFEFILDYYVYIYFVSNKKLYITLNFFQFFIKILNACYTQNFQYCTDSEWIVILIEWRRLWRFKYRIPHLSRPLIHHSMHVLCSNTPGILHIVIVSLSLSSSLHLTIHSYAWLDFCIVLQLNIFYVLSHIFGLNFVTITDIVVAIELLSLSFANR